MPYTPLTCTKAGEVPMRLCLGSPFVGYVVFPVHAPNFAHIKYNSGTGQIEQFASYIDNGTLQSFITDEGASPIQGYNFGGFYTGSKLMAHTRVGSNWYVGYINHAYADADNTSSAALTLVNLGNGGVAPIATTATDGAFPLDIWGESELGGDRISWLEGRTTEVHILTATTAALSRKQAFEIDTGSESWRIMRNNTSGMIYDGTSYWFLCRVGSSGTYFQTGPYKLLLVRFTPTTIGDPFDYDISEITFDDADINTAIASVATAATVSGDTHHITIADSEYFAGRRRIEIAKDGTSYTEYVLSGNATIEAMCQSNLPSIVRTAGGGTRAIGYAFESDSWAEGTYDLTCSGNKQGHIHTQRIRKAADNGTGNLIPSGDMDDGDDLMIPGGDMDSGSDNFIWG